MANSRANPFDDLVPQNSNNPFSDLLPENAEAARQQNIKQFSNMIGANTSPISVLKNVVSGVGEAGQNIGDLMMKGLGRNPGADINIPKTFGAGDTLSDKAQQMIGQYGIPGGAVAKLSVPLAAAGEYLEGLGGAGKFVANVLSQGTPQAAFMATQTENPLTGVAAGFGGQAAAEALPYAIPVVKGLWNAGKGVINTGKNIAGSIKNTWQTAKQPLQDLPGAPVLPEPPALPKLTLPDVPQAPVTPEFQPEAPDAANDLLKTLGGGAANKEESSTALASIIRDKYNQRLDETQPFFQYPMKIAGDEKLYEHVDPLITTALDKEMDMMSRLEGLNVKPLFEQFKNAPTIQNAHYLQSELGSVVGDLEKNTDKTVGDRNTIASINSVRSTLKQDIMDAFKRHDATSNDNLTPMYQTGIDLHKTNVEPYRSSPALREITVKGVQTPKNPESIFDTPTNTTKQGVSQTGPINKVMQDLPDEAKGLILFNKIGASKYSDNPQGLVDALDAAKNEGYSSYFTPETNQAVENVKQKIASDAESQASAKVAQANAIKQQDLAHKNMVAQAKSDHKNQVQQIKDSYKTAKTNAVLDYKSKVSQIKQQNNMIKDARKTRNWTLGGLGLAGAGLTGIYNFRDKIPI